MTTRDQAENEPVARIFQPRDTPSSAPAYDSETWPRTSGLLVTMGTPPRTLRMLYPRSHFASLPCLVAGLLGVGCSSGSPSEPLCLDDDAGVAPTCAPAYEPTYDALYDNTFKPGCAASGVSCHASTGRQGGIDFDDREASYTALTQNMLRAGRPECSIVVRRVIATDGKVRMPPGRSLPPGEQCAIIKWIADGAKR